MERFANLFGERHFPLYQPYFEFFLEDGDEPPWSWLRRGIPFDLMGFGYDGLHEMWNGYREGLSAMALLVRPPDVYYDGPDGLRVAWLESAAERIPQQTLQRVPEGGIPLEDLTEALKGTRFEGAAQACSWLLAETGNFFLDNCYDDGSFDGFCDPWEDEIIAEGTEEWRKANALMDSVSKLTDWLEDDLPGRFAEMLEFVLARLPDKQQERRTTTMSNEPDTTQWSLPGPADAPRDDLKLQLEVYGETILLRGFDGDSTWVRTVSADEIANVFTQHLGFSSGLLPQEALWWNQGETGQVVALWRPPQVWSVALQREAFKPPARLRLPMPGLVFVCSPGRAPWVYAATGAAQRPRAAPLPGPGLQRLQATGGSAPEATGSPRRWDRYRSPSSSPSSPLPETPTTARRSTPKTWSHLWEEIRWTDRVPGWKTLFPSVRWPTRWRSPREDVATATASDKAGAGGLPGEPPRRTRRNAGDRLRLRSRLRRPLRPVRERPPDGAGAGRPLRRCGGWLPWPRRWTWPTAPSRHALFELGLRWFQDAPDTERFFAVRWDGRRLPAGGAREQAGTATRLAYTARPQGVVAEFHSHGRSRSFFSKPPTTGTSRASEYTGWWEGWTPLLPELSLRVGVYGHFAPLDWPQVFSGANPGVRLMGRGGGLRQTFNCKGGE